MASRSQHTPAYIKGHLHFGYGGDTVPENVTITEYYDLTSLKKSKLRPDDELVPKPHTVDVTEKVIKLPVQREHPHTSHVPRYAVFPYSHSSDNVTVNKVIVQNKTIGCPHRKEVLLKQTEPKVWPGQQGYYDYPKQMTGVNQVFFPTPPKIVCPNAALSARSAALTAHNFKMFQDWEKSKYITTYKREYPGKGPLTSVDERTLEGAHPRTEDQLRTADSGRDRGPGQGLLELQDSFSRSDALRDFHRSTKEAKVNLQDSMRTGKQFFFQGMCSHYFRNRTAVPLPVA